MCCRNFFLESCSLKFISGLAKDPSRGLDGTMTTGKIRRRLCKTYQKLGDPDSVTSHLFMKILSRKSRWWWLQANFLSRRLKLLNGIFRYKLLAIYENVRYYSNEYWADHIKWRYSAMESDVRLRMNMYRFAGLILRHVWMRILLTVTKLPRTSLPGRLWTVGDVMRGFSIGTLRRTFGFPEIGHLKALGSMSGIA